MDSPVVRVVVVAVVVVVVAVAAVAVWLWWRWFVGGGWRVVGGVGGACRGVVCVKTRGDERAGEDGTWVRGVW